jgi:hypothetical protein
LNVSPLAKKNRSQPSPKRQDKIIVFDLKKGPVLRLADIIELRKLRHQRNIVHPRVQPESDQITTIKNKLPTHKIDLSDFHQGFPAGGITSPNFNRGNRFVPRIFSSDNLLP